MDRRTDGLTDRRTVISCAVGVALFLASSLAAQAPSGPLVVFNAGSLAAPIREALMAFQARHPGIEPRQESSGSIEAARKLTELGRIPDLFASADAVVIPALLVPLHATWYATFARTSMVLLYSDRSIGAGEIDGANWWRVLLRPGVRVGRSDPALDPAGYRALFVVDLAERYHREPGLARRLLAAMPLRYVRPKSADLIALLQAGELDYAWGYRSYAVTTGLKALSLPPEIDLSDPALGATYSQVGLRLPGATRAADSVEIRGAPIVFALTIPAGAPNPRAAAAFTRFLLGPEGQAILRKNGFMPLENPVVSGTPPSGAVP